MKKFFVGILMVCFLSGCAFFRPAASDRPAKMLPVTIQKRAAIAIAQDFMKTEGMDDEFSPQRVERVAKLLVKEEPPRWAWQVFFTHKEKPFWKVYKKDSLMIQVDAREGKVEQWGRR